MSIEGDLMSDPSSSAPDVDDEQATAEELDEDRFEDDLDDFPPDHPVGLEAAAPIETGDVPQDSLEERLLREEPDVLQPPEQPDVDLIEPEPDGGFDPEFAAEANALVGSKPDPGGALVADGTDPTDGPYPAEEAAMHVIEPPG